MSDDPEMSTAEAREELQRANAEEYKMCQELILMTCRTIMLLPLAPFINAATRAETMGPILDPTAYREGGERLSRMRRMAEALHEAQKKIMVIHEEIKVELKRETDYQKARAGVSPPNLATPAPGP